MEDDDDELDLGPSAGIGRWYGGYRERACGMTVTRVSAGIKILPCL